MQVTRTIDETRAARAALGRLAFVPTMGAMHEGHRSLIRRAKELAHRVAVSIFINPTQFNDPGDLETYPRPIEEDLEQCRALGVDLVFNPTAETMYPPDEPQMTIDVPALTGMLEGAHRPGHFVGVCRICMKLFNIVQPRWACFGQKDYQQLKVVEAMVAAGCLPMRIVACPTVRAEDGLALSSRNAHLSAHDRTHALGLRKALIEAKRLIADGQTEPAAVEHAMRQVIEAHRGEVDYTAVRDPRTLGELDIINPDVEGAVCLVAAKVGGVRLIDNTVVGDR